MTIDHCLFQNNYFSAVVHTSATAQTPGTDVSGSSVWLDEVALKDKGTGRIYSTNTVRGFILSDAV